MLNLSSKKRTRLLVYLLLFILVGALIYFAGSKIKQEEIISLVQSAGIFGPLIYIFFIIISHVIAHVSVLPVFLSGYVLYKSYFMILTLIANTIGATISFWIAKLWGRNLVIKMIGVKNMQKVDELAKSHGLKTLVFLRVFVWHLADFVSYAYGLTKMRFTTFILISFFAQIPWIVAWQYFLVDKINNLGEFTILYSLVAIPFWIISILFFAKLKNKK
jgi:uncharacterized membrane protein YdjX (TVP38/TMEM64 family)